jgi:hypothetical protein
VLLLKHLKILLLDVRLKNRPTLNFSAAPERGCRNHPKLQKGKSCIWNFHSI